MKRSIGHLVVAFLPALAIGFLLMPATSTAQTPALTPSTPEVGTPAPTASDEGLTSMVDDAADLLAARTPIPTPDPGFVQREVAG